MSVLTKIVKDELKFILSTEYRNNISKIISSNIKKNKIQLTDNQNIRNSINSTLIEYLNVKYVNIASDAIINQINKLDHTPAKKTAVKSNIIPVQHVKQTSNNQGITVFTDGACSNNGKPNAIAGIGILFDNNIRIHKANKNVEFSFNMKEKIKSNPDTTITFNNSNIRAEGYAILYSMWLAKFKYIDNVDITDRLINELSNDDMLLPGNSLDLQLICDANKPKLTKHTVTIVTDSKFWIDMNETYIPKWITNDIYLQKKNCDMVIYMTYIKSLLANHGIQIVFRHVRSHTTNKILNDDEIGNDIVDKLAVLSKKLKHFDFILEFAN